MNGIVCQGLDGSNPLHFLAALGVLRLVSLEAEDTTLCWTDNANRRPMLCTQLDERGCRRAIASRLGLRGVAALQTRRARLLDREQALSERMDMPESRAGTKETLAVLRKER